MCVCASLGSRVNTTEFPFWCLHEMNTLQLQYHTTQYNTIQYNTRQYKTRPDPTRPAQSRAEQNRAEPDHAMLYDYNLII